jgi:hypothetical protein
MKNRFKNIAWVLLIGTSCMVDDYTDANPPRPLDGPAGFLVTPTGKAIVDTETDGNTFTYVPVNQEGIFNIDMVDVPGLIDSIGVELSDEEGEVSFSTEAEGEQTGSVSVTYVSDAVGTEDIVINVFDAQEPRKAVTFNPDRIKRINATCFASRPLVGFYDTVTSGFNSETGENYTDLESVVEFRINAGGVNHPGFYRLTDGSFGLYPEQGFAANFVNITVCDNNILDANEEFAGNFTGTLNADGTISITWSNTFGDTGTTVMTPR